MLVPHWQGLGHVAPAHDEDGEADKDEKCATDSYHCKCPEVDLPITWEVVSTDFLRKQLVILLHDPQRSWPVLCPLLVPPPSQPWDRP